MAATFTAPDSKDVLNLGAGGLGAILGGPWGTALSLVLPTLLGSIFGGGGEDLVSMRKRAQALLEPNAIENERATQLANLMNNPAIAAARSQMVQGGQTAMNGINNSLAQTGLLRSGVGLGFLGSALASPDVQMGRMMGGLANDAMERALQIQQARADAIMRGGPVNSMARDMFGATVGAFLPAFLNAKFPKPTDTTTTTNTNTNKPVGAGTTVAQATGSKFAYPNYMAQQSQPVFPNAQRFNELRSRFGRRPQNNTSNFYWPQLQNKFSSGLINTDFNKPFYHNFYVPNYSEYNGWDTSGGFNQLYGGR
jgi:hypothetical protein